VTRLRHPAALLVLVLVAFGAPASAAYAYWTATATVSMTITTSAMPSRPAAPTNLTCGGSDDPRTLTWSASTGATEYRVYRDTGALLSTVTLPNLQISESTMGNPQTSSQRYDVFVRAWNEAGESASSAALSVSFKKGRPC
jgi:hypothetical protein